MAVLLFHFGGKVQDVQRFALTLSNYFLTALTLNSYQLELRLCNGTTTSIMRLHQCAYIVRKELKHRDEHFE